MGNDSRVSRGKTMKKMCVFWVGNYIKKTCFLLFFYIKRCYFGALGKVWSQAGTREAKKVEKGKNSHPILEGILAHFQYV